MELYYVQSLGAQNREKWGARQAGELREAAGPRLVYRRRGKLLSLEENNFL